MAAGMIGDGNFEIRAAKPEDCQEIIHLIKELADYENYPSGPKISAEVLLEDGFGERPFYQCFVATMPSEGKPLMVGYSLYFFTYSTWEGRALYMEDLYVKPEFRKQGIGIGLWKRVAQEAVQNKCKRLDFSVLDWNQSSIDFYHKMGAKNLTKEEGWHLFRLTNEQLNKFASS